MHTPQINRSIVSYVSLSKHRHYLYSGVQVDGQKAKLNRNQATKFFTATLAQKEIIRHFDSEVLVSQIIRIAG